MPIPLHNYVGGILEDGFYESVPFFQGHRTPATVNATATLTAAQVSNGYIKCTSTSAVTMTLPTGTLLGTYMNAKQGDILELYIDNTASSSSGTVTVAVGTNAIISDAATTTSGSFGQLTVAVGATGVGRFTLMFTSATSYVFTRTA